MNNKGVKLGVFNKKNNNKLSTENEVLNYLKETLFEGYDTSNSIGRIDLSVSDFSSLDKEQKSYFLWLEVKKYIKDIKLALAQCILTVGNEELYKKYYPPLFLGAADREKIVFIRYADIQDIFNIQDINWKVAPSRHNTKEIKMILDIIEHHYNDKVIVFDLLNEFEEVKAFILNNFSFKNKDINKVAVGAHNFVRIYNNWLKEVLPSIGFNFETKDNVYFLSKADFYIADLLHKSGLDSEYNLNVSIRNNRYVLNDDLSNLQLYKNKLIPKYGNEFYFNDGGKMHENFWNKYEVNLTKKEFDYIIERRDLLLSDDERRWKGGYYTTFVLAKKAYEYITNLLGENWQDEYYIWDCAAGTGNLLSFVKNKDRVFASTLDEQDVLVMLEKIRNGKLNISSENVFQFDFMRDDFKPRSQGGLIPDKLYDIIKDPEKSKKLIIIINPPYAEPSDRKNITEKDTIHKAGVVNNPIKEKIKKVFGISIRELSELFAMRIRYEIPSCYLFMFSKIKYLISGKSNNFQLVFKSKYLGGFIINSKMFENVTGEFPVSFAMWRTECCDNNTHYTLDVYNKKLEKIGIMKIPKSTRELISKFVKRYIRKPSNDLTVLSYLYNGGNDIMHALMTFLHNDDKKYKKKSIIVHKENFIWVCVYFAIQHSTNWSWINDRDMYYYPDNKFEDDKEFLGDCVVFTIFSSRNKVSAKNGINHYIPYTHTEVGAKEEFKSRFVYDLIYNSNKISLSPLGKEILDIGREIFRIYHSIPGSNPNASFFDIREYFKNKNDKKVKDLMEKINILIKKLKEQIRKKGIQYKFIIQMFYPNEGFFEDDVYA